MQQKTFDSIPQRKDDITKLPACQLRERLERQEKLLANPVFLGRLPDRGEKVRKHADNLRAALTSRQMVDDAAKQLEEMSLGPAPGEAPAPAKAMLVRYQGRPTQQPLVDRSSTASGSSASTSPHHSPPPRPEAGMDQTSPRDSGVAAKPSKGRRDLDAVRERIAQAPAATCKLLTLEESSGILQAQERRVKELEQKYAAERLKALVGKHNPGPLPDMSSAEFRAHRGHSNSNSLGASATISTGDQHRRRMEAVGRQFVGDNTAVASEDDDSLDGDDSEIDDFDPIDD